MKPRDNNYILPENRPTEVWKSDKTFQSVYDGLLSYSSSDIYPFHMPGHKRNTQKFGDRLNISLDMTESEGMENLHQPIGPIKKHQEEVAESFGAAASFYMINGSSGGILAGIRTATKRRDTIIIGRNAHKSSYHAIEICDLNPVFISPDVDENFGIFGSVNPRTIRQALEDNPKASLVAITSPTFEGVVSDVEEIAEICHEFGALLLVDQAHGAHFRYAPQLFKHALACGADIVIESLHKTLPSLTSTAIVHLSDRVDADKMRHNLAVFETTSPSHLLMASIDECILYLQANGLQEHIILYDRLKDFSKRMKGLEKLQVLCMGDDRIENHPSFYQFDPSKIVISTMNTTITGMDLKNILREDYRLEVEMAYGNYAMGMATIGDEQIGFDRLAEALIDFDQKLDRVESKDPAIFPAIPRRKISVLDALEGDHEFMAVEDAKGLICSEYAWAYPPGIPLLTPGEVIDEDVLRRFRQLEDEGIRVNSSSKQMPEKIRVVKDMAHEGLIDETTIAI